MINVFLSGCNICSFRDLVEARGDQTQRRTHHVVREVGQMDQSEEYHLAPAKGFQAIHKAEKATVTLLHLSKSFSQNLFQWIQTMVRFHISTFSLTFLLI